MIVFLICTVKMASMMHLCFSGECLITVGAVVTNLFIYPKRSLIALMTLIMWGITHYPDLYGWAWLLLEVIKCSNLCVSISSHINIISGSLAHMALVNRLMPTLVTALVTTTHTGRGACEKNKFSQQALEDALKIPHTHSGRETLHCEYPESVSPHYHFCASWESTSFLWSPTFRGNTVYICKTNNIAVIESATKYF